MISGSLATGIMITYVLDGPTHVRITTATSNASPYVIPVPVHVSRMKTHDEKMTKLMIESAEIDDRVRHSINESPRHIIDSNRQLYNEIPVPYSKSSFNFPKIRIGRDVD